MRKISKDEALALVHSGAKGYWSPHAKKPVCHTNGVIVRLGNDYYDTTPDEFSMEFKGRIGDEIMSANATLIGIHNEELQILVLAHLKQFPKMA